MSSWEEINSEFDSEIQRSGPSGIDTVRRSKLRALSSETGRPLLLYAVDMFNSAKIQAAQGDISINSSDKDGFFEALRGISGNAIDVIIHSPGGSPEATESLVNLLRSRFNTVRFIVPSIAKSAATMLAMSGDEIILGENAELGPTDPQMVINGFQHPAHAILEQFDMAKREISQNPATLSAWIPILQQYGPSLLTVSSTAIKLSVALVKTWIAQFMLRGERRSKSKATIISKYLSGNKHLSHSRAIDINELIHKGVKIKYARDISADLSELISDVHQVTMGTFARTGAYKIYENNLGKGVYKLVQVIALPPNQAPPTVLR